MDGADLLKYVKLAALQAVGASMPCEIRLGNVVSEEPLKIMVEQRLVLGAEQLILPRRLTRHKVKIKGGNVNDFYYLSQNWDKSKPLDSPHFHAVGEMEIEVFGELKVDDEVILIRQQGGQKYLVFDLIG